MGGVELLDDALHLLGVGIFVGLRYRGEYKEAKCKQALCEFVHIAPR